MSVGDKLAYGRLEFRIFLTFFQGILYVVKYDTPKNNNVNISANRFGQLKTITSTAIKRKINMVWIKFYKGERSDMTKC